MNLVTFEYGLESIQTGYATDNGEYRPAPVDLTPNAGVVENNTEALYQTRSVTSALIEELAELENPKDSALSSQAFHQLCQSTLKEMEAMHTLAAENDPALEKAIAVMRELDADRQAMLNHLRALSRG